ncbi:MAG TPA: ABC transporter substrate binding protein [Terriglobales bacterium]|nr:ABC transporter substrate binding protein [Terriglobales bacterium]
MFLESSLGPTDTEGCRDNHHHPGSPRRQSLAKLRSAAVALIGFAEHDPVTQRRVAAFLKRLADLGWTLDRNVAIDFRYGAVYADKNRAFAKELVNLNPDVIFVNSSATAAVQRETTIIPVVFATVSDPVGSGFAASLARPGGNNHRVRQCRGIHCREVVRASDFRVWHSQTSRSRPGTSVHWGEAVKVTPRSKCSR